MIILRRRAASGLTPKLIAAVAFALVLQLIAGEAMSLEPDWPASAFERADVAEDSVTTFGARNEPQSVDMPRHAPVDLVFDLAANDSVIVVEAGGEVRAYPHRVVAAHEIINDELGGVPIAVTYCRVCAASVVFDRRLDGDVTTLHLTGFLHNDNIVLFDAATETWWQQYDGTAISQVEMKPALTTVESKVMSYQRFKRLHGGELASVLLDTDLSRTTLPFGNAPVTPSGAGLPVGVDPLDRVVVVGDSAVPLDRLRQEQRVDLDGTILEWQPGRSATPDLFGRDRAADAGDVVVYQPSRYGEEDVLLPQAYRIDLAHAFQRFVDGGRFELTSTP